MAQKDQPRLRLEVVRASHLRHQRHHPRPPPRHPAGVCVLRYGHATATLLSPPRAFGVYCARPRHRWRRDEVQHGH
eukprot:1180636-Prorocentrum_minimum.AAC.3